MNTFEYTLRLLNKKSKIKIGIKATSIAHAQGQAEDIMRALNADKYALSYGEQKCHEISDLFKKLAFNEFTMKDCCVWERCTTNNNPCDYVFNKRIYIRPTIIKYLDLPEENFIVKNSCGNRRCVNPYHFEYHTSRNSKLTCGDLKLLVAYRSQGTPPNQIAKVFNVHPSTIYRTLNREYLHSRATHQSRS